MADAASPAAELREAAEKIRASVAEVPPMPWVLTGTQVHPASEPTWVIFTSGVPEWARYLSSWNPGVALALADLLDQAAQGYETLASSPFGQRGVAYVAGEGGDLDPAIRTARAYLGTGEGR